MSLSKSSFSSLCQLSVSLREREKDVGILTTDSLEKEGGLSFPEDFKALSFLCRHLCPILGLHECDKLALNFSPDGLGGAC